MMRRIGIAGVVLVVLGIGLLAALRLTHTKDHDDSYVGPVQIATIKKGVGPPIVAVILIVAGVALISRGRKGPV